MSGAENKSYEKFVRCGLGYKEVCDMWLWCSMFYENNYCYGGGYMPESVACSLRSLCEGMKEATSGLALSEGEKGNGYVAKGA